MKDVLRALGRTVPTQLHPRMLGLAVLPFVLGGLLCLVALWLFWEPLVGALGGWLAGSTVLDHVDRAFALAGIGSFRIFLAPFLAVLLIAPATVIVALALIAVFAMPLIVAHVASRSYPDLRREGDGSWWGSAGNAVVVSVLFAAGWLVSIPFWIFPPLGAALPWLLWTYAFNRILVYDALMEHATAAERRQLRAGHRGRLWALSALLAAFNYIPLLWFVLPVLSGIAFTHYCLQALRELRQASAGPATGAVAIES